MEATAMTMDGSFFEDIGCPDDAIATKSELLLCVCPSGVTGVAV
jgi:hypothetical protein